MIQDNPFKLLVIGEYVGTETIPTVEQLAQVLHHWKDDKDFIDLLQFEALTGARVEEVRFIRSSQVNFKTKSILLTKEQTKLYKRLKKKRLREIFLNDDAMKIVKRNAQKHPDGLLFQNPNALRSDNGWHPNAVGSRFARAEKTLGFRIQQKGLRHLFATRYLKSSQSVAGGMALLGHTTPKMIMVNYNKILQDKEHLLDEVNRVTVIRPKAKKNGTTNNGNAV
jgi:integrase